VEDARVPTGVATLVATVAIGNRHSVERLVRYVIGRGATCRGKATGVTDRALVRNCHLAVVPYRRFPARGGMAADAICRSGHVRAGFAGGCIAVVATGAIGATIEHAVIGFGTQPRAGGLVAVLAHHLTVVNRRCRARRSSKAGAHVAGCTLRGHRHIGVKLTRVPAGIAPLVAAVTVCDRHPAERLVRDVVGRWPIRRRKASRVAGRALIGHGHLTMVPVRGLPGCGGVAADAIGRSGYVRGSLAGRSTSVVATGTIGRRRKPAMVHARCGQPGRGFVACAAGGLRLNMPGRLAHGG
jgi:hypothetical protein